MQLPNNIQIIRPIHDLFLPALGKMIHITPYNVEEEKVLLTANEEKESSLPIITNFKKLANELIEEDIDLDKISYIDFIYLTVALRCISKDPIFEGVVNECKNKECKHSFDIEIDILKNIIFENKDIKTVKYKLDKNIEFVFQPVLLSHLYEIKEDFSELDVAKNLIAHSIKALKYKDDMYVDIDPIDVNEKIIGKMSSYHVEKCLLEISKLVSMKFQFSITCPVCEEKITHTISNFLS